MFFSENSTRALDSSRREFDTSLTARELDQLVFEPQLEVLACSRPVPDSIWEMLNERFFAKRPDVQLRVYAHYSSECDLSFARRMTNVRKFAADCLQRASNVEAIGEIPGLQSLSLGIYDLESFRVLELTLTELRLGATNSRKPTLRPLERFHSLKFLYVEGPSRDIEVLSELENLEDLTLRSITTSDLRCLSNLSKLWSLDIKLGGLRSFAGIEGKECIKYLEVWQVRQLSSVDIVAELPGLQNLFLQSLPHIKSLPSLDRSRRLRRIRFENMKGLNDFSALEHAPALEEFSLIDGKAQSPQDLLPVLRNPAVRLAEAGFGSDRKNKEFARLRDTYGKHAMDRWLPFEYIA